MKKPNVSHIEKKDSLSVSNTSKSVASLPDNDPVAEKILDEARNSIGSYCLEECKGYCCRKGFLVLTDQNLNLVTQGRKDELIKGGRLMRKGDKWCMYMGESAFPCPCLNPITFKCAIYNNPLKPRACHEFPIFIEGGFIKLSPKCLAVKEEKLYPYVVQLLNMGYKLYKGNVDYDIDFEGFFRGIKK